MFGLWADLIIFLVILFTLTHFAIKWMFGNKKNDLVMFLIFNVIIIASAVIFYMMGFPEKEYYYKINKYDMVLSDSTYVKEYGNKTISTTEKYLDLNFSYSNNDIKLLESKTDFFFIGTMEDTVKIRYNEASIVSKADSIRGVYVRVALNKYDRLVCEDVYFKINNEYIGISGNAVVKSVVDFDEDIKND